MLSSLRSMARRREEEEEEAAAAKGQTVEGQTCVDSACYQLTELTERVNEDMDRMQQRLSREMNRLTEDATKARAYAQRDWRRERQRLRSEHDWVTGFFQGRHDQATGRSHSSFLDTFASAPNSDTKADWAAGYYYGRMDEARRSFEKMLDEARENSHKLADEITHSAHEASQRDQQMDHTLKQVKSSVSRQLGDTADEIASAKKDVMKMLDERFDEAAHRIRKITDKVDEPESLSASIKSMWQDGILNGIKTALMDHVDDNRHRMTKETEQIKEGTRQMRDQAHQAGDWLQDHLQYAKDQVQDTAESAWNQAQGKTKNRWREVKDKAKDTAESGWDSAREQAEELGDKASEELQYRYKQAQHKASDIKDQAQDAAESVWDGARDQAEELGDQAKHQWWHVKGRAKDAAESAWDSARDQAEDLSDWASDELQTKYEQAERKASGIKDQVQDAAESAWDTARDQAEDLSDWASDELQTKYEQAGRKASDIKDQVQDAAGSAWSMARDQAEDLSDWASDELQTKYEQGKKEVGKASEKAQSAGNYVNDQARQAVDTAGDALDDLRKRLTYNDRTDQWDAVALIEKLKAGISSQARQATGKQQRPSPSEFLEEIRGSTATYLARQVSTVLQDAKHAVRSMQQMIERLGQNDDKDLRRMARQLYRQLDMTQDAELRDAMNAAGNDRDRVVAYVRGVLQQVEHDAQAAYDKAQQMRDETAETIRQRSRVVADSIEQLSDSNADAIEKRFKDATHRVASMLEHTEDYAKRQYQTARRMSKQAEIGVKGDLNEFLASLRGWLSNASDTAEERYASVQAVGRAIGDELINTVDTVRSSVARGIQEALAQTQYKLGQEDSDYERIFRQYGIGNDEPSLRDRLVSMTPSQEQLEAAPATVRSWLTGWWHWLTDGDEKQRSSRPADAMTDRLASQIRDQARQAREQIDRVYEDARDTAMPAVQDRVQQVAHQAGHAAQEQKDALFDRAAAKGAHIDAKAHSMLDQAKGGVYGFYAGVGSALVNGASQIPLTLGYGAILLLFTVMLALRLRRQRRQAIRSVHHALPSGYPPYRDTPAVDAAETEDVTANTTPSLVTCSERETMSSDHPVESHGGDALHGGHRRRSLRSVHTTTPGSDEKRALSFETPERLSTSPTYSYANQLLGATDALHYAMYILPVTVLFLGVMEYKNYNVYLLHLLFVCLSAAQVLQSLRDYTTYSGRTMADVGEASTMMVLAVSAILSLYTFVSGAPLV